ncbi:MAG: serine hydrolase [Paracoccaceae bacterium]|nr:serine hydrolase [Paracoccaceae bacterium]
MLAPLAASAAPYAALVMDARNGKILYEDNADTRLHPASLTKMLTLYITFDAIRRGEITLDTPIKVTAHAAGQEPSRLGLRPGEVIALRYLIRAAAVKSANDAAAAIGDALGGSEAGFAERMNAAAKALGMMHSTFKNANGLTRQGHLSTAHDMAILARHLIYDFPDYYNIFSRRETFAGIATVYSTNAKFLNAYSGADGIKTGFTWASGFNLVASAKRGNKRVIGVIFGGTSTDERNHKMMKLLDLGFSRVPENEPLRAPVRPILGPLKGPAVLVAQNTAPAPATPAVRPAVRPGDLPAPAAASTVTQVAQVAAAAKPAPQAIASLAASPAPAPRPAAVAAAVAAAPVTPEPRPAAPLQVASADRAAPPGPTKVEDVQQTSSEPAPPQPKKKPEPEVIYASTAKAAPAPKADGSPEIVSRMSTSGGRDWAVTIGRYNSKYIADKTLMEVALSEPMILANALRKVVRRPTGFEADFLGLTHDEADLACARLQARAVPCFALSP